MQKFEFNIENFEKDFLNWYDAGMPENNFFDLYGRTISHYIIDHYSPEEVTYGDPDRWCQVVIWVVEILGRYFFVSWDRGLTEMQENYYCYDNEIAEAELKREIKEVIWWDRKDK